MGLSSAVLGMLLLASSCVDRTVTAETDLPWDGRGLDLTVDTLTKKFLTNILTTRNDSANNDPANYVTITQDGRSPAFNEDTGVIDIAVDDKAIIKNQTNCRRSELVQTVKSIFDDKRIGVSISASVMKKEAFVNPYVWQLIFPESRIFEIRVDATADPAKIIYLNNGTEDIKWEAQFVPGTWYNFEIGVILSPSGNGTVLQFFASEGDGQPVLKSNEELPTEFSSKHELHYGILTVSDDGTDPELDAKPEVVSFNGLSAMHLFPDDYDYDFDSYDDEEYPDNYPDYPVVEY